MVTLGQLISMAHGRRGYFLEFKVHWGDVYRDAFLHALDFGVDPFDVLNISIDEFDELMKEKFRDKLKEAAQRAMRNEARRIIIEELREKK